MISMLIDLLGHPCFGGFLQGSSALMRGPRRLGSADPQQIAKTLCMPFIEHTGAAQMTLFLGASVGSQVRSQFVAMLQFTRGSHAQTLGNAFVRL